MSGAHRPDRDGVTPAGQPSIGAVDREDELLLGLITSHLPPDPTPSQVLAVHERTFAALWLQLAPLMGNGGAQTLFTRAIQLAERRESLAAGLRCTGTGLDFTPLRARFTSVTLAEAEADAPGQALRAVATAVEDLISRLLGPGLSRSLLRDVQLVLLAQEG